MNDDAREERLMRRLSGPLDAASTRVAEERVWRRLAAGEREPRHAGRLPAFAVVAAAIAILLGGAWLGSYRLDVASGGLPVLYREQVAHVDIAAANGVSGSLDVAQGHFSETAPGLLRVVAVADVRLTDAAMPATLEIRYRDFATGATGVLARTADLSGTRRATGEYRYDVTAPFPPVPAGETHAFDVWIHVDTPGGAIESPVIAVEVRTEREGQRARLTGTR